ncbi:MAG: leucine-rich repeat domain-containing protein [archaeon]
MNHKFYKLKQKLTKNVMVPFFETEISLGEYRALDQIYFGPDGRGFKNASGNMQEDFLNGKIIVEPGFFYVKKLDLHDKNIRYFNRLVDLPELVEFNLKNSGIVNIQPLRNLKKLEELNLSNNNIEDISGLKDLTNLWKLNLSNNKLSDISYLSNLENLTELYLSKNQISYIEPLSKLTNLTKLSLENDYVADISPLMDLPNLKNVRLFGNPLTKKSEDLVKELRGRDLIVSYAGDKK